MVMFLILEHSLYIDFLYILNVEYIMKYKKISSNIKTRAFKSMHACMHGLWQ